MKRLTALALLACVLLAGCATERAASPNADAAPAFPPHLAVAARFALALETGDGQALSALISPVAPEGVLQEMGLISGAAIDDAILSHEWNGRALVTTYQDITITSLGEPDRVICGVKGQDSINIGMVETDGVWRVETVNGQAAYLRVLAVGPAGQVCMDNMAKLYMAGLDKEFASQPLRFPEAPQDLVPQYLPQLPVCPSRGVYSFDVEEPVCSVHGGRNTYLGLQ